MNVILSEAKELLFCKSLTRPLHFRRTMEGRASHLFGVACSQGVSIQSSALRLVGVDTVP